MSFGEDLQAEVKNIFRDVWSKRDGYIVPESNSLKLGNDAVELEATVLYADMARSTILVDNYIPSFAAEIYKAFLTCCAKIIKNQGGVITAYDGDRVMGVFIGVDQETCSAKAALKINHAVKNIIAPAIVAQYPKNSYILKHAVGIDTSKIFVARVGVKNDNDLVWVGRAANYAAKLCNFRDGSYASWITGDAYDMLDDKAKYTNGKEMWEKTVWETMGNMRIYRSSWTWPV
jgi:class 3 adenylate cyclase